MHARWTGHLCGLCLSLRDSAGQSARVLTGYDVLLVSVLAEAQAGRLPTTTAGPCPLRGLRTAEVIDASTAAMRAGTAAALLVGEAGLADKLGDGDVPVVLRPVASRTARRLAGVGGAAADSCGWDATDVTTAPRRANVVEGRPGATLDELLEPTAAAVAAMFAHSAVIAGVPGNAPALRRAGDAFGRIVHLIDGAEDRDADRRAGRFNPLEATGTTDAEAARLARSLHAAIGRALDDIVLADGDLARALLGPPLGAALDRVWPVRDRSGGDRPWPAQASPERSPRGRSLTLAAAMAATLTTQAAQWGGGRGRRGWGGRYGGGSFGGGFDPYSDPRYRGGYGRRRGGCGGPSCGEILACDCCANCLCSDCCGGDTCCCVC